MSENFLNSEKAKYDSEEGAEWYARNLDEYSRAYFEQGKSILIFPFGGASSSQYSAFRIFPERTALSQKANSYANGSCCIRQGRTVCHCQTFCSRTYLLHTLTFMFFPFPKRHGASVAVLKYSFRFRG